MRNKPELPNELLQEWLQEANAMFTEGKTNKALSYLYKNLKTYEKESLMAAFLYTKYEDLWRAYCKRYPFHYQVVKMPDKELQERISGALHRNRSYNKMDRKFQHAAEEAFQKYLECRYSLKSLYGTLSNLEDTMLDGPISLKAKGEIYDIFNAYFFQRKSINRAIVEQYDSLIRLVFNVRPVHEQKMVEMKKKKAELEEELPEAICYVTDMDGDGKVLESILIDPTIPNPRELSRNCTNEERKLAAFKKSLHLEKVKEKNGKLFLPGWSMAKEKDWEGAKLFEAHNEHYISMRENALNKLEDDLMKEMISLSSEEQGRIARIYYKNKKRWLTVK